jgi:large subunit ribosomal protein L10
LEASISTSSTQQASATAAAYLNLQLPDKYIAPTKPPSARRPEYRKSQLLRSYTALLRSTPLILFFQHNNLTASEWSAVRRELRKALGEMPISDPAPSFNIATSIELQVMRTRMLDVAFKIVEFFDADAAKQKPNTYAHDLSEAAYEAIKAADLANPKSTYAQISPVLTGPIAALTFPIVSPAHLKTALSILSPSAPAFPAPSRKKNPGYYDPIAQNAFQKLLLIGGRVEGRIFDDAGVKWVGGIEGGLDGLRAQLVHLLQSAGLGLTTTLEGGAKGLWLALESRRTQLDEEANGGKKETEPAVQKKE